MRIGIIDADLLDHGTRHPNLALMKISAFMRQEGHVCDLVEDYADVENLTNSRFDKLIVSRVFKFTRVPKFIERDGRPGLALQDYISRARARSIIYGGTGFTYPGRSFPPNLPYDEIEHICPDYSLYSAFVQHQVEQGKKSGYFKDYTDFSIGFTTRGCFRKCPFCVNKHYSHVEAWSPVEEFVDPTRPYIYLWDDNFLGLGIETRREDERLGKAQPWERILDSLDATGKPFQFRQGLDMRLMTDRIAERFSRCRYHGDYIFAFDHIQDSKIIAKNIDIWRKYNHKLTKLYVLCGFDSIDEVDIGNTLERIRILMEHGAIPYIMRYENYVNSRYRGLYVQLARWCNQPQFFKKKSFREYCEACQDYYIAHSEHRKRELCAPLAEMRLFESEHPAIAKKYFDIRFDRQGQ